MYEQGAECEDDRRGIPYCNHIHEGRDAKEPVRLTEWLPMVAILLGMVVSWTTLNTTITRIDVNQINLKEDMKILDKTFAEHNSAHAKAMSNVEDQVNSLEHSMTSLYQIKRK